VESSPHPNPLPAKSGEREKWPIADPPYLAAYAMASWFETRGVAALLTMRV
jgi:hypothetical protein